MTLPDILPGVRIRVPTPHGTMHVVVTTDEGMPIEIFATVGKAGDVIACDLEGMCRIASKFLQRGGTLQEVIDQWSGIGSALTSGDDPTSIPDCLARALKRWKAPKETT